MLAGDRLELGVDDVEAIEAAGDVFVEIAGGDFVDFVEARSVVELRESVLGGDAAEFESLDAALASDF